MIVFDSDIQLDNYDLPHCGTNKKGNRLCVLLEIRSELQQRNYLYAETENIFLDLTPKTVFFQA